MRIICLYGVLAAVALGGCAAERAQSSVRAGYDFSKLDKIAIIEVSGALRSEAAKNQIGDFFAMELLKKGYTPIERSQVKALLAEQKFQTGEITSAEDAARAGRILNVPTVMMVNIPTYREEINMTAKMIDVEDAGILWIGSGSGRTGKTLSTIFGAAAGAAGGAIVAGGDSGDKTIGGIAGGVLGGAAGQALSPQEAEQAQKIISSICINLPWRLTVRQN